LHGFRNTDKIIDSSYIEEIFKRKQDYLLGKIDVDNFKGGEIIVDRAYKCSDDGLFCFLKDYDTLQKVTYDGKGRVIHIGYPGKYTESYQYTDIGKIRRVEKLYGYYENYFYDEKDRLLRYEDSLKHWKNFCYNEIGEITEFDFDGSDKLFPIRFLLKYKKGI